MSDTTPPPDPGTTAPPPPPPAPPRLLRRSSQDRWLGGVAGGVARYLDIDPVLARVGLIALAIVLFVPTVVLYVVSLFLIPADDAPDTAASHPIDRQLKLFAGIAGLALLIGLLFSLDHGGPFHTPWFLLVALLIVAVVWVVRRDRAGQAPWGPGPPPWARPGGPFPPPAGGQWSGGGQYPGGSWSGNASWGPDPAQQASASGPGAGEAPTDPSTGPVRESVAQVPVPPYPTAAYAVAPHAPGPPPSGPYAPGPYPPFPSPAEEPRERSALGPLTVGAALVTAGVLVGLDRTDALDVPAVVVFASALTVVGLGLIVGTWFGRSRRLIALGVVLAVFTALAGLVHFPANNSIGDQTWRPASAAEVQAEYAWGVGDVELDLTGVTSTTPVATSVEIGVGDLTVLVPRNATVNVTAHVGMGAMDVERGDGTVESVEGINRDLTTTSSPTTPDPAGTTFDIDLSAGMGHLEVRRA